MRSEARLALGFVHHTSAKTNALPRAARELQTRTSDEKWPIRVRALIFVSAPIGSWATLIYAFQQVM